MKWLVFIAGATLVAAGPAFAQDTPIPGAETWKMVERAPPIQGPPCFARSEGPEVNTSLSLNKAGQPVLMLGRGNEWSGLQGQVEVKAAVDGAPSLAEKAFMAINLIGVVPSDALIAQLHRAHTIEWTLPMGVFRGQIEGFDAAVAAIKQCMLARDGRLPAPESAPT